MTRIIGQCNTADFKAIEHLTITYDTPEVLDYSTLSRKQKLAVIVMFSFIKAGIRLSDVYLIKEILFWDNGGWEFKFFNVPGAKDLLLKLNDPVVKHAIEHALKTL